MVVNIERLFSEKAKKLKTSQIRELLKLTQSPDLISLAGGLPNAKAFPVESIHQCVENVFEKNITNALQYGTTEGLPPLRAALAERMRNKKKMNCEMHDILITNGAQQALSLLAFILIDPGDTYLTVVPAYLGAVQAFHAFEANCESIPMDNEGIDIASLRRNLKRLHHTGIIPKFLYTVPNFQNPSGETMTLDHRKQLLEIASEYDFIIIEDDPYGDINFSEEVLPSIKSFDTKGRVVYLSTFSKIMAPGFRLGWTVASQQIIHKLTLAKQAMDLCTNVFSQYIACEYLEGGYIDDHIEKIKKLYKHKRDVMLNALEKHFPEEVHWTLPKGGMFIWITLPKKINTHLMFQKALEKKVAYVSGDAFFPENAQYNSMRLNFSYSDDKDIKKGIKRLSEVIKEELACKYEHGPCTGEGV
ncbi:MAG: PLP-dependent aminotransferase family protein [Thermoplasmatota archaeon]